ncbi:TetR/AcrR family transcriptional regulator [Novosphingobium rosa]|uniref:TetR/AcrR family transcriptional regulator n=1 Tax=Novosphingobium rosa TaxID=76978 RepID=UPI00082A18AD|nr:TetR/AcrR family transcriptional regulator [Novosphingobium rosa]
MTAKRVLTERAQALPALAECFRTHGFEGASLSLLCAASGLGKGSLYNFFPGGKAEMMEAVLAQIDDWFAQAIFAPLEQADDPATAITAMMAAVTAYFHGGGRVCLMGWIGLSNARDGFAGQVEGYFARWIAALARCLKSGGVAAQSAMRHAEDAVAGMQGALVLSRALGDQAAFTRLIERLRMALLDALAAA